VVKLPSAWLAERDRVRVAAAFVAAGADGLLVSAEGAPSRTAAHAVLAELVQGLGREVCVISVGGIDSVREAQARLRAGARLIQLHRAIAACDVRLIERLNHSLATR
jgi:dihydroorotate dehydrogenase